jgi:hypothetical protein
VFPGAGGQGRCSSLESWHRRVKTRDGEAPAEPPNAGPRCERLPAFSRSSRDRCSARGRDVAQQELRPPGAACCRKVNAIGHVVAGCVVGAMGDLCASGVSVGAMNLLTSRVPAMPPALTLHLYRVHPHGPLQG